MFGGYNPELKVLYSAYLTYFYTLLTILRNSNGLHLSFSCLKRKDDT